MTTATPERAGFYDPPLYGTPESPAAGSGRPGPTGTFGGGYDTSSALAFISTYFGDAFGGALQDDIVAAYRLFLDTHNLEQALYSIRQSKSYAARFAGMKELQAKGRAISEGAYLDLERQYTQIARQFDLPPGFYDEPSDFARLIGGEVAPVEWQRRLSTWQTYERETRDPAAEAAIREQFAAAGMTVSDGDFLAAVIDPAKSLSAIERRLEAGIVSGAAARSGFGALTIDQGLTLADRGVTRDQAEQGFGLLSDSTELFTPGVGEVGGDTLTRDEQVGAAFLGNAEARRRVERQRARRLAAFEGGGGGGLGRSGLAGLGGAG